LFSLNNLLNFIGFYSRKFTSSKSILLIIFFSACVSNESGWILLLLDCNIAAISFSNELNGYKNAGEFSETKIRYFYIYFKFSNKFLSCLKLNTTILKRKIQCFCLNLGSNRNFQEKKNIRLQFDFFRR